MPNSNEPNSAVVYLRDGGRRVELLAPFEFGGHRIDAIDLGPLMLDHVLRWQAGEYKNALDLLGSITGLTEKTIRQLRYPDADRVFAIFLDMLPPLIRGDIDQGVVPERDAANPPPMDIAPGEPRAASGPVDLQSSELGGPEFYPAETGTEPEFDADLLRGGGVG